MEIIFTYANEVRQSFYLSQCSKEYPVIVLEKLMDGEWETAYSRICYSWLAPPIEIGTGEHFDAVYSLTPYDWDPDRPDSYWRGGDIEGTYRLRSGNVNGKLDKDGYIDDASPSEIVVSNTFEIRREH